MSRQEMAASDLETAAASLRTFVVQCPDEAWSRATAHDGRTVASLAYHCASGNDLAQGWICQMLSLRPVQETGESHNAANDAEALRSANVTKEEVIATLDRTTARAARFLRSLTDEELERKSVHGIAGREMSVAQFIPNFGRHVSGHLETLNETLKGG